METGRFETLTFGIFRRQEKMSKDSNSIAHNWVEKDFNSKYKGRIEQSRKMGEYSMTDTHDPDLAEGIEESNSEKDLLTDSLDSIEESENFRSVSEEKRPEQATEDVAGEVVGELNIASAITKPVKNSENERKLGNSKENKKKHSLKSTEKTTSVLNTASFSKVRSKMSYSELYRRKLHNQKISKVPEKFRKENMTDLPSGRDENKSSGEKKVIHEASDQVEGESSLVEIETVHNLHNGYANSGHCYAGLQTNESYQSHNGQGINNEPFNKELDWINYGTCNGNRSRQSYDYTSPRSELIRSSDYLNQAPITNLHSKNFHINPDEIGVNPKLKLRDGNSSRSSPPIQEVPTSVRSAPADIYMHHTGNSHYEMPYRRNSVCTFGSKNMSYSGYGQLIDSMASTSSKAKSVKQGVTGYSGMYNKQHTYQPYTLCDYKRLKQITPGGLGPNTNSEEHKKKVSMVI